MRVKLPDFKKLANRKPTSIVGARTTFILTDPTFADEATPVHDDNCPHLPSAETVDDALHSRRTQPQVSIELIWGIHLLLR